MFCCFFLVSCSGIVPFCSAEFVCLFFRSFVRFVHFCMRPFIHKSRQVVILSKSFQMENMVLTKIVWSRFTHISSFFLRGGGIFWLRNWRHNFYFEKMKLWNMEEQCVCVCVYFESNKDRGREYDENKTIKFNNMEKVKYVEWTNEYSLRRNKWSLVVLVYFSFLFIFLCSQLLMPRFFFLVF